MGAGFGGLFCAKGLLGAPAYVTLINRENHHIFQPLLYQVATGFLGINDVALPVRSLFHNDSNVEVVMAEVTGVDSANRQVITDSGAYSYDYLVLAAGSRYHYFGHDEWGKHALVLKNLEDAILLRQKFLGALEAAERESDPKKRKALLTFVVIGGGPTGVEMAGAIADAIDFALRKEFRHIKRSDMAILIIEASNRLLNGMPEALSLHAHRVLMRKGVMIQLGTPVVEIRDGEVITPHTHIQSGLILWAAGVQPIAMAAWIQTETDRRGAVAVEPDLSVKGQDSIYAIGDAASFIQDGKPLPALGSVAKQQGVYLARLLRHHLAGHRYKPFRYRDWGTMATIGRNQAVADFGRFHLKGWFAWMLWGIVHVYFLTGWRNRIVVFFTWIWTYLTYGMGARILLRQKQG